MTKYAKRVYRDLLSCTFADILSSFANASSLSLSLLHSINEILSDGLKDAELGCKGVCSHVKDKTLQETCGYLCDAIGLIEFLKFVKNKDFDPIYFCEGLSAAEAFL